MWVDVFKVGVYENSDGTAKEWTDGDLQEIVDKYNDQNEDEKHVAPIVFGHPEDDAPAYGWVEKLRKKGKVLQAKLVELSDELVEGIKSGAYKFQSISLYPNKLFRHLGILGAMPPKVKGLKPLSEYFGDKNDGAKVYEFTEEVELNENDQLWIKAVRDKYGEELMQDILSEIISKKKKNNVKQKNEETNMSETIDFKETKEYRDLVENFNEANNKIKELTEYAKRIESENKELQFNSVFSELVNGGYLLPAQKDVFNAVYNGNGYEFSDGVKDYKQTLIEFVKSFPKQIEFSEKKNEVKNYESEYLKELGLE